MALRRREAVAIKRDGTRQVANLDYSGLPLPQRGPRSCRSMRVAPPTELRRSRRGGGSQLLDERVFHARIKLDPVAVDGRRNRP